MPIPVSCTCGQRFAAPDHLAGKAVKCPKCQQPFTIPVPPSGLDDLLDEVGVKQKAVGEEACPSCGESLLQEAVICVHCGFDRRTGKAHHTTTVQKVPVKPLEAPTKKRKKRRKAKPDGESSPEAELGVVDFLLIIFCGLVALIVAIIRMVQGDPRGVKMLVWFFIINAIAFVLVGLVTGLVMVLAGAGAAP